MSRKFLSAIVLFVSLILCPISVFAYDFAVANDDGVTIYYNKNGDGKSVSVTYKDYRDGYTSSCINIPASVTYSGATYSVTTIGDYAFFCSSSVTEVSIPNSITTINRQAFSACSSLSEVTIPNSVTTIGAYAFSECSRLAEVTIGEAVSSIGSSVFFKCSSLTTVNFNAIDCKEMGSAYDSKFGDALSVLNIGDKVTNIPAWAFYSCKGLTEVTIPNSVTTIGDYAFYGCISLAEVTIGEAVSTIGLSVFENCSSLTTVNFNVIDCKEMKNEYISNFGDALSILNIGDKVTNIPAWAFRSCKGLTEVTIPNSVTTIGDYAFYGCSGLAAVTIGNSVTTIGGDAFYDCSSLAEVVIGNSVTTIGDYAFLGCPLKKALIPSTASADKNYALTKVAVVYDAADGLVYEDGMAYNGDMTKLLYISLFKEGECVIPETVTSVAEDVAKGCENITEINALPVKAPETFENSFDGLYKTAKLTIPDGSLLSYLSVGSWYLFEKLITYDENDMVTDDVFTYFVDRSTQRAMLIRVVDKSMTSVSVPSRVVLENGDDAAFYQVTEIGPSAFVGMTAMTEITLSAYLTEIYPNAFNGCAALKNIQLPTGVRAIGARAFADCTGLISASFPQAPITIGDKAFYNCQKLRPTTAILADSVGEYAFANCLKITDFDFSTVTTIGASAFYSTGLREVVIPPAVESIGKDAFASCGSLGNFTIADSAEPIELDNSIVWGSPISKIYIGREFSGSAFTHNGMKTLEIGRYVTAIPDGAFEECLLLTNLSLNGNLTAIGSAAFRGCSALPEIVIPRHVTTIGESAFDGCTTAARIAIGCGIEEIGAFAFRGVSNIPSVCVAAVTPPQAYNNTFSKYIVPLYVPQESTQDYDNTTLCWYRFEPKAHTPITEINVHGVEQLIDLHAGQTIRLTAEVVPSDASLPYVFWRSTNPEVATVDNSGLVTIVCDPRSEEALAGTIDTECEIILETLYADFPVLAIKVDAMASGIDDVAVDQAAVARPLDIYTLQGVCLKRDATDADIRSLAPGLYIIGGKKTIVK